MKNLNLAMVVAFSTCLSAMAIFNPNWERPLFEAQMTEYDASSHEVGQGLEKILSLNQRDGYNSPTTLTFTEETYNTCLMLYLPGQNCPLTRKDIKIFVIESTQRDGCGSITYQARELMNGFASRSSAVITLNDHRADLCDHVVLSNWDAQLSEPFAKLRSFRGNPAGVATAE